MHRFRSSPSMDRRMKSEPEATRSASKLPDDYTEIVLDGGNHGNSAITARRRRWDGILRADQQQQQTVEAITAFIGNSHQQ